MLDARLEAQKLRDLYKNGQSQKNFSLLVVGNHGTGKTLLLSTARKPVHIDSFDPGGTKPLRDLIDSGDIIVDTKYENEDPFSPTMFPIWESDFLQRVNRGYFKDFGTYVLDSFSAWSNSAMYHVMKTPKEKGRVHTGDAPDYFSDYNPQKYLVRNRMRKIIALTQFCNVIVTGHLKDKTEAWRDNSGQMHESTVGYELNAVGTNVFDIPNLFDEVYISQPKEVVEMNEDKKAERKLKYLLITASLEKYKGKTRIGRGKFAVEEEMDLVKLTKKCGWYQEDKERLF